MAGPDSGRAGRAGNATPLPQQICLCLDGPLLLLPALRQRGQQKQKLKHVARCGNAGNKSNKIAAVWTLSAMPLPQRGQQPIGVRDINAKVPGFVIFYARKLFYGGKIEMLSNENEMLLAI